MTENKTHAQLAAERVVVRQRQDSLNSLRRIVTQIEQEETAWVKRRRILHQEIGGQIRILREERKMSLRELARRLGLSAPYISDMELGRRGACGATVEKIINILGNDKGQP